MADVDVNICDQSRRASNDCLTSIQDKLSRLSLDTLNYGTVCIFKVPEQYRNENQGDYMPNLVSIGLIHHGENHVQSMEKQKLKYLNDFLRTFQISLPGLVDFVDTQEKLACGCYESNCANSVFANGKTPSEVILLDGVFVVELFLKNHFPESRESGDMMFSNSWVSNQILHDLLLLENQLPLMFMQTLYDKFVESELGQSLDPPSFIELAHEYFKDVGSTGKLSLGSDFQNASHFGEFLSTLHMPLLREKSRNDKFVNKFYLYFLTAKQLRAAGVKFEKISENCDMGVDFDAENGVLKIQQLTINVSTETFFRSSIVFENTGLHSTYVTSIVMFLSMLIDTNKDVDILINCGIIKNELPSNEDLIKVIYKLYREFRPVRHVFLFDKECSLLDGYNRGWWQKIIAVLASCSETLRNWIVMFVEYYSNSPWIIISAIAGAVGLVLTAISAVYAVKAA